jgi:hypothetical protein
LAIHFNPKVVCIHRSPNNGVVGHFERRSLHRRRIELAALSAMIGCPAGVRLASRTARTFGTRHAEVGASALLVACRLAGLSALEGHYAGLNARAQRGRRSGHQGIAGKRIGSWPNRACGLARIGAGN